MGQQVSSQPLPIPRRQLNDPCKIVAEIDCVTLDQLGRVDQECDDLLDPRTFECTDQAEATSIAFRYLGGVDLPNDSVYITVSGGRTGQVLARIVNIDEIFRADGDFRGDATIEIFTVQDGAPGERLRVLEIDTSCDGGTPLTVTGTYGPLELVGFGNAYGYFTSIRDIRVDYFIGNDGTENLFATSANINSHFQPPFEALGQEQELATNSEPLIWLFSPGYQKVYSEDRTVDLAEKYRNGDFYAFSVTATGRSESGDVCSDKAEYSF